MTCLKTFLSPSLVWATHRTRNFAGLQKSFQEGWKVSEVLRYAREVTVMSNIALGEASPSLLSHLIEKSTGLMKFCTLGQRSC
jgi:hypothetical protein